jgi:polyisoprenoid-binding protein YceI
MKKGLIASLVLLTSGSAWADWQLDNDFSRVNFVSVKKNIIGEAHRFTRLKGVMTDDGKLSVEIPLASVETLIPIRNERIQKMLFETKLFPTADISAKIPTKYLQLKQGESIIATIQTDVGLHGVNKLFQAEVLITRTAANKLLVTSLKPLIVNPSDFGLDKGILKLQAVAKLPSITQSVPVSFVLSFKQ